MGKGQGCSWPWLYTLCESLCNWFFKISSERSELQSVLYWGFFSIHSFIPTCVCCNVGSRFYWSNRRTVQDTWLLCASYCVHGVSNWCSCSWVSKIDNLSHMRASHRVGTHRAAWCNGRRHNTSISRANRYRVHEDEIQWEQKCFWKLRRKAHWLCHRCLSNKLWALV